MRQGVSVPSQGGVNLNRFNYRSRPTGSLQQLLQSEFRIRSLEISPHGKTGVIFIETNGGSFVLKSNNEGPMDEFLNRMAGLLNLSVPETICYCCSDLIFHKLIFEIERFCVKDEVLFARMKSRLDFPFYQIIEYVPSVSLAEVGCDRFEKYLLEVHKLNELGMCIGFDLLTNNSDRFKLLWGGDGNINNVLIEVKDFDSYEHHQIKDRSNMEIGLGSYVFIDHSGYLLDLTNELAAKNFERYMQRVCNFHIDMIRALSQQYPIPKQFDKLRAQIKLFTHYSLTDFDLRQISRGIVYVTNKFLQIFEKKELQELFISMKKGVSESKKKKDVENNYWNQYWNEVLSKINLSFLKEVYTKMAAIYTTYPEIVRQIIEEVEQKMSERVRVTQFAEMDNSMPNQGEQPEPEKSSLDPGTVPNLPSKSDPLLQSEPQLPFHLSGSKLNSPEPINEVGPQQQKLSAQKQPLRRSVLSNHELFAELKVARKWRDKLVKYKQVNSDHPQPL